MSKKQFTTLLIILIILAALIIGVFSSINSGKVKELDINSDLVKTLHNYVLEYNAATEETAYQNRRMDINSLSDVVKTLTIFENVDLEKESNNKIYNDNFSHDEYCEYYFTKEFIDGKVKSIFGKDAVLNPVPEILLLGVKINFMNNNFVFVKYPGGGGLPWTSSRKLVRAEKVKNNIYIYDKYIHVVEDFGDENGIISANPFKCYNASDRKKIIFEQKDNYPEITIDTVKNADTFKHTFAKAKDGSYYWVSTEIAE